MWILRFYNQYNQELTRLSIKNESSKIYIFSKWKESYHDNHDKDLIYAHVFVTSGKICERPTLKERDREKDACVRVCIGSKALSEHCLPRISTSFCPAFKVNPYKKKIPTFSWLSDSNAGQKIYWPTDFFIRDFRY